ncbi:hypothetical protein [Pseudohaliea rubra]|uniref:Sodium-dependent phosphate transporter n=1 Tax=Pseudohaliea rubra DSM 19751 TaxID=1265313 RepID=A0A095X2N4_9GAMM|nr:hypothetical protein [Pseudohaliea rubra]KGE05114.1 Sodium-dependent phosphate transporter [Pseudohaliea rubra DSM 19751]
MLELGGTFPGGLGLFILAVAMITDGLKLSAGEALRSILASSTRTRLRGVLSGALLTARPQFLDRNVLGTPDLALRALCLELARLSAHGRAARQGCRAPAHARC